MGLKVEKNARFGDYRISDYDEQGNLVDQIDANWTECQAKKVLRSIESGVVDFDDAEHEIEGTHKPNR